MENLHIATTADELDDDDGGGDDEAIEHGSLSVLHVCT